jgi:hypothetical protein
MFLAVVPLQEIATSSRSYWSSGFTIYFGAIGTLIIAMIMISTLLVTMD